MKNIEQEKKSLTKTEKIAISLNFAVFAIVVVSGIIRILVECDVIRNLKNNLAYQIVDGIFILIAVVLLIAAYVLERKIKQNNQEESNNNKDNSNLKNEKVKNSNHKSSSNNKNKQNNKSKK